MIRVHDQPLSKYKNSRYQNPARDELDAQGTKRYLPYFADICHSGNHRKKCGYDDRGGKAHHFDEIICDAKNTHFSGIGQPGKQENVKR